MLIEIRNISHSKIDIRNFGLVIGSVLLIISGFLFWKDNPALIYTLTISLIFVIAGTLFPIMLKPIYIVWMTISIIIGWFMTRLILIIVYLFILTPIGLLMRTSGKKFLDLSIERHSEISYWINKDSPSPSITEYEKQY
ncbi:hypothetical protein E3V33_00065 [Candidatus Marinimicrobia bacterium MT.SAG.4]|nr:hypothetical protein E3V33_00065 [Candidatus Marinimicrobia bacterium MT.SAG.4]